MIIEKNKPKIFFFLVALLFSLSLIGYKEKQNKKPVITQLIEKNSGERTAANKRFRVAYSNAVGIRKQRKEGNYSFEFNSIRVNREATVACFIYTIRDKVNISNVNTVVYANKKLYWAYAVWQAYCEGESEFFYNIDYVNNVI